MINNVALTGRLARASELKYTQSGTAVASFTLAVDRNFTNGQGQREADFINCVIWRKSAENFSNFTRKGALVGIEGRIQTRTYDDRNGQRVYVTEVVVNNFALLESKATTEARPSEPAPAAGDVPHSTASVPVNPQQEMPDTFANNAGPIDITDDDLPF